jgi:hypothetical protein
VQARAVRIVIEQPCVSGVITNLSPSTKLNTAAFAQRSALDTAFGTFISTIIGKTCL